METIRIETLVMPSNNENDISEMVKKETIRLLISASFFLKDDVLLIYDRLWKYIFDLSKNGEEISFLVLKENFKKYGVECVSSEAWLKFPKMNEFVGRKNEMQLLTQVIQKTKKVSVLGISGIGKSYMVANWAKKMKAENENVCWISLRANMTYSKLINILGSFIETTLGKASFKDDLENREIGEQVENISNILENYRIIFVLDSYEKASGNIQYFLSNVFKSIKKSGKSIMIVTTTQRMELYTESDIKLGKVYEYILDGFPYEFKDKSLENTEKRISVLESKAFVIRYENKWRLNRDIINLKMLILLEYVLKKRYSAMSMSLGYIPIFSINHAFYRQELLCEWEHCIEFMLLEQERGARSCPIFGHNCPEGEEHVIFCKESIEKEESLSD